MLQTQTVTEPTLALLIELMEVPELSPFFLVGGTNLSLRLGHRISVDLDLFTDKPFDSEALLQVLEKRFSDLIIVERTPGALLGYIHRVKVDFILYEYPMLNPVEEIESIRFASLPDIAAMKVSAISRRGVQKDFWDFAELMDHLSIEEMLAFFKRKHKATDLGHLVRSLVYFFDAEANALPVTLKKYTWNDVKNKIEAGVRKYVEDQTKR